MNRPLTRSSVLVFLPRSFTMTAMKPLLAVLLILAAFDVRAALNIDTVIADRALWPKMVTARTAYEVPILQDGQTVGQRQIPAGYVYPVISITADGIEVDAKGTPVLIPAADTDLLDQAAYLHREQMKTKAATAAAAPAKPVPIPLSAIANMKPISSPEPVGNNILASTLSGLLISREHGDFEPYDSQQLANKKYIAVYFSAHWCPPCRQFTPLLVEWYRQRKASFDNFDIVFVSGDKSPSEMKKYMSGDHMDWPALKYEEAMSPNPLSKYRGRGIPHLVLLDESGNVLSSSVQNGEYVGPGYVLREMDRLVTTAPLAQVQ